MNVLSSRAALFCLACSCAAQSAELKPETLKAFSRYIQAAEARMDQQLRGKGFLWLDFSAAAREKVRKGEVFVAPWRESAETEIPEGLIHDWIGTIFIPGATLESTLKLVQDYDHHKTIYKPEVIGSELLDRNGNDFRISLRLLKKKVITVVLNTEHKVRYHPVDSTRCYSRSYSTKIAEVRNAGSPEESELPAGQGHGFLWRLNSYWKFQEADGGVYLECRAISLTRDVPTGLGWVIQPIIRGLPKDSVANTLKATRDALSAPSRRLAR